MKFYNQKAFKTFYSKLIWHIFVVKQCDQNWNAYQRLVSWLFNCMNDQLFIIQPQILSRLECAVENRRPYIPHSQCEFSLYQRTCLESCSCCVSKPCTAVSCVTLNFPACIFLTIVPNNRPLFSILHEDIQYTAASSQ